MSEGNKLRSFNLNTLPILREILLQGSVGKAAVKLNVSQPALSGALKQLRFQFDDELLVRVGATMKLTPKAEALLAPLEQALFAVQQLIDPNTEVAGQQTTVIRIASTDHVMSFVGEALTHLLLQQSTSFLPHFMNAGAHSPAQLLNGEIDFVISTKQALAGSNVTSRDYDSLNSEPLFSESLVGIGRGNDTDLISGLSVEEYLARPHVTFALDSERNMSIERIFLASHSLRQNDVARFSCYTALLGIVASTECIALVPSSIAQAVSDTFGIRIFTPPIAFPPLEWTIVWHRRNDEHEKFFQFRTILKSCVRIATIDPLTKPQFAK